MACILALALCLGVLYTCGFVFNEAHDFWRNGHEAEGEVLSLYEVGSGRYGTHSYYYNLAIENEEIVGRFNDKMIVGDTVTVLFLPEAENKILLANPEGTLFDTLIASCGGIIWAVLIILLTLLMLVTALFLIFGICLSFWKLLFA